MRLDKDSTNEWAAAGRGRVCLRAAWVAMAILKLSPSSQRAARGIGGLAAEALGATLAVDLDLPVPEAHVPSAHFLKSPPNP